MSFPLVTNLSVLAALCCAAPALAEDVQLPSRVPSAVPWTLLPRAVTSFGAAVDGGRLYVFGGYHGTPHDYSREGQSHAFQRLSLVDPRDVELLESDEGVQGACLAAHEGRLLRVGGLCIENAHGEPESLRSLDGVAWWDEQDGGWTDAPALPEPRSSHRLVICGERAVVVGGWSLSGARGDVRWHDTWLSLDLTLPDASWTSRPAPFARRALGLAATDTHVVAVGGMDGASGKATSEVWILDVSDGTWRAGPTFPDDAFGASACAIDGRVFASARSGIVWSMRPGDDAWTPAARLAYPRFFHELLATPDGELVAVGGIADMDPSGRLRHVERVTPAPDVGDPARASEDGAPSTSVAPTPARVLSRLDVPTPARARNRQGVALVGHALYLFGGNRSTGQHDFAPDDFVSEGWRLSLADLSWRRLPEYPARRQSMQATASPDGRELWFLGGFGHDGDDARTQAGAWAFDLELEMWRALPDLPVPATQFGLATLDGKTWMLGGLDYDPDRSESEGFTHVRVVQSADATTRAPSLAPTDVLLPEARRAFGSAVLDGEIYLVGGMADGFARVTTSRAFDPSTRTFRAIASPRAPRISPELVTVDGRLVLFGGVSTDAESGASCPDPSIEVYDPASDRWHVALEDVGIDVRQARAFATDGRLLVVSFQASTEGVATIVLIDV